MPHKEQITKKITSYNLINIFKDSVTYMQSHLLLARAFQTRIHRHLMLLCYHYGCVSINEG